MLFSEILILYKRPVGHLPCPGKATLAVRCCPVYFELRRTFNKGTVNSSGSMILQQICEKANVAVYSFMPQPFNIPLR